MFGLPHFFKTFNKNINYIMFKTNEQYPLIHIDILLNAIINNTMKNYTIKYFLRTQ